MRRIKSKEHKKVPWLNGEGFSWNILMDSNHPNSALGQFGWRFATAKIDKSGLFSGYKNVDRIITLLSGKGFELAWNGDKSGKENGGFSVSQIGKPHAFPGDQETHCELLDGPVQVLNLMVDRNYWAGKVHTNANEVALNRIIHADVVLLFALQEAQAILVDNERIELAPRETLLIRPSPAGIKLNSIEALSQSLYIASLASLTKPSQAKPSLIS